VVRVGREEEGVISLLPAAREATMATPWLTGAGALGHMRIRRTVDAHVAAQEREIAIGFGKKCFFLADNEPYHELLTVTRTLLFHSRTTLAPGR
jgi:hypothetical protein